MKKVFLSRVGLLLFGLAAFAAIVFGQAGGVLQGGAVPGGVNTQVQFNSNGAFGGDTGFVLTPTSGANVDLRLGLAGTTAGHLTIIGSGSNPALSGAIRITGTGGTPSGIAWRNQANTADVTLTPGASDLLTWNGAAGLNSPAYGTATNCSSSASPAVCASAAAGSVVIAAAATTVTVNTTAVTANSQILIQEDDSLGTKLAVTCNTTSLGATKISARVAGTSFTITTATAPVTNPACLSYSIVN